ncbi:TlpA disulfide reductase family protein [Telmatospirillum sp.]|uniref:TlpA disulfide reductase family protein n=1 Tax=Telmatospirillum sp. TaxID=2079197 RepID=UPI002840B6D9|nr:TlpA disulfide reductase family protein [Telmatospirillum sp.]MDR3441155.1 TlpA disulfide reductase family protein [Telmatospirillum sp.]
MIRLFAAAIFCLIGAVAVPVSAAPGGEPRLTYIVPAAAESDDGTAVRPMMPDLVFADGSGMPQHLTQFRGQVVIVNFWSSSCAPCLKDLAALDRLQGDYRSQSFSVIDLSEDAGTIAQVRAFLSRQKYGYLHPYADANGSIAQALGISSLPVSLVIDRQGRLAQKIQGSYPWESSATVARLRHLLGMGVQ